MILSPWGPAIEGRSKGGENEPELALISDDIWVSTLTANTGDNDIATLGETDHELP